MANKKKILAIVGIGLILIGVVAIALKVIRKPKSVLSPISTANPSPQTEEKLLTYTDEAGFNFEYPESLTVKDVSGNQDVYSILEITAPNKNEKMIIRVVDTKYKSVDDWLKAPEATGAGAARSIELAGMAGQQIQLENPRRLVTIAIDKGVMYYFESPLSAEEGQYWNMVHNTIVLSFSLGEAKPQTGSQGGGGEEVIYEEEEVVE